jgi:hypothetical protein
VAAVSADSDRLVAEAGPDFVLAEQLAAIDRRHACVRNTGAHYADAPAEDPPIDYEPRHRRTDAHT